MASITNRYPCLQINAPEWYRRADFRHWLFDGNGIPVRGVATWHTGCATPSIPWKPTSATIRAN